MKKLISFILSLALIVVLAVPVSAVNDSGWIELLEYSSVQSNGENFFTMGQTGTLTIPLQGEKRLRKVDLLIWNPTGQRFTSASCTAGGKTTTLDILSIGSNLTRIVGFLPESSYEFLRISLKKSTTTTQTYEVLSCKVTPIGVQEFEIPAEVYIDGGSYGTNENIVIPSSAGGIGDRIAQIRITVTANEWRKYDSISIWGSATDVMINSIRATIGTTGIPFTLSFMDSDSSGSWFEYDEFESGFTDDQIYSGEDWASGSAVVIPEGKILYCLTIDLANCDRSLNYPIYLYFTGLYEPLWGYSFNCQYVNGSLTTADTTANSWWQRFTSFMNDLFGAGDGQTAIDDLGESADSISEGAADIHNFEQSQQDVLSSGFATIQSAISFTSFSAALIFVQKYANLAVSGISKYMVVFTLPLFLGLFFYLCSRVPGITRWKPRPPQKKGGNSP